MTKSEAVLQKLNEIEKEMRRICFCDDSLDVDSTRDRAVAIATSERRSPVGLMSLEHWLQAVFVPNARKAAQAEQLPGSSEIAVMAMREYDYHSHVPKAQRLLKLITEFDKLF